MNNFTKATKKQAVRLLDQGHRVIAISSKLNPRAFNGAFTFTLEKGLITDSWIKQFKYYNCNKECGTGINFFSITSDGGN